MRYGKRCGSRSDRRIISSTERVSQPNLANLLLQKVITRNGIIYTTPNGSGGGTVANDYRLRQSRICHVDLLEGTADCSAVVGHRAAEGPTTDFLEGGNSHRSQEADDNYDDHDFDKGEALGGVFHFHRTNISNVRL